MIIDDLKEYMEAKRMTQEAIAVKLGISFTTVNRWLRGKRKPSQMAIHRIEDCLRKK